MELDKNGLQTLGPQGASTAQNIKKTKWNIKTIYPFDLILPFLCNICEKVRFGNKQDADLCSCNCCSTEQKSVSLVQK